MKRIILSITLVLAIMAQANAQTNLSQGGTGWGTSTTGDILVGTTSKIKFTRLPIGTAGTVLQSVLGQPAWVSTSSLGISGGSATPAGSDGQVQFNSGGLFGASTSLFWNNSLERLGIGTSTPASTLAVSGNISIPTNASFIFDGTNNSTKSIVNDGASIRINNGGLNTRFDTGGSASKMTIGRDTISANGTINVIGNLMIGSSTNYYVEPPTLGAMIEGQVVLGATSSPDGTAGLWSQGKVTTASEFDVFGLTRYMQAGLYTSQNSYGFDSYNGVATVRVANANALTGLNVPTLGLSVGTTTPNAKLSVVGTFGSSTPLFDVASTTSSTFATTSVFKILSNGIVNIYNGLNLSGLLNDSTGNSGTTGDVLVSTGTSTKWTATSSLGIVGSGGGSGTVTSVDMTVPTGFTVSGNPITTLGTLALNFASGYALPLIASTTELFNFWTTPSTRITAGTNLSWSGNTLNATGGSGTSTPSVGSAGYLQFASTTAGAFDGTSTLFYDNTNGRLGLGNSSPSHTITLDASSTGIALYNTKDQTTNFERVVQGWNGNSAFISSGNGGTGIVRPLVLAVSTGVGQVIGNHKIIIGSNPAFNFQVSGTDVVQNMVRINTLSGGLGASSSIQNMLLIDASIAQSLSAGYCALCINIAETSTGTGTKMLISAGTSTSASLFTVSNQGRLGLGTSTSLDTVDIYNKSSANNILSLRDSTGVQKTFITDAGVINTTNSGNQLNFQSGSAQINSTNGNITLISGFSRGVDFGTSTNTQLMRMTTDGFFGIGTSTPTEKLHLYTNTGSIRQLIQSGSVIFQTLASDLTGKGYIGTKSFSDFSLRTGDTDRMSITQAGNVGIGATSPDALLQIFGGMHLNGSFKDSTNATGTLGQVLLSTGTSTLWTSTSSLGISGGGGSGYATVQNAGTPLTARSTINFTGSGVTCADNGGTLTTDCTITSGGGAGLSGGAKGLLALWDSASTLVTSLFMDNGTVTGIGATSTASRFNVLGNSALASVVTIASSTGNIMWSFASNGTLGIATTTDPTVTGLSKVFLTEDAGRPIFSLKSLDNVTQYMQNAIWSSNQVWYTPGIVGAGLWQNTVGANLGTAALVSPTVTANPYTAMRRTTFASVVTTNNQQVGTRSAVEYFRGGGGANNSIGGFFFVSRVGFTTWTAGDRFFTGLSSCTTACLTGTTTLTNLVNAVGFGVEAGTSQIVFLSNDASGVISTTTLTGAPTLASNNVYDFYIYQPSNKPYLYWEVEDASTTQTIASGMVTTNLPATTTLMAGHALMSNGLNATVGAAIIGVGKIYIETDR